METMIPKTRRTKDSPGAVRASGTLCALDSYQGRLLYGAPVARKNNARTLRLLRVLKNHSSLIPGLAVIHLGENADDQVYRTEIIRQARRLGMPVHVYGLSSGAGSADIERLIGALNQRPDIGGILVQTMHDRGLRRIAHECLSPAKDPEGVTAYHRQQLVYGEAVILPCTPAAIRLLIMEACGGDLSGKTVAIVNSSPVIGLPLSQMLAYDGATVTLCGKKTADLPKSTRDKDVIVAAVGATDIIKREHVGKGQIVIDAAIVRRDSRVNGCVQIEKVIDRVKKITPVPGGVGPVTTSFLLDNTVRLFAGSLGLRLEELGACLCLKPLETINCSAA